MKYRNAAERLPPELLQELQRHAQGETLYVPKAARSPWGERTGAKSFFSRRNADIRQRFSGGAGLDTLGAEFFLSEDAVKKVVYEKGGNNMDVNETNYSGYFWQNDLVRVRLARADDWKHRKQHPYDSDARFFTDYEQELPTGDGLWQEKWESYINANRNNGGHIIFSFENLTGECVGGGNLHGIDERNGTFGMYVSATEEQYAIAGARLLLAYAFNERRLNNCHTGFMENDTIYKPVFEKLGFQKEGTRRQQIFHKGRYWNEELYGLLADEFRAE